MKECDNRYPWDAANDAVDGMRRATDKFFFSTAVTLLIGAVLICAAIHIGNTEYEQDYGLGSVVTTTAEYETLTGDFFIGVIVRGETRGDPALTVRNRDGVERRIATEFLEPME